jgi:hypothetical protein
MGAATSRGKVICFHCRRPTPVGCGCATRYVPRPPEVRLESRARRMALAGLWLAGAAVAGSLLGAALALLGG